MEEQGGLNQTQGVGVVTGGVAPAAPAIPTPKRRFPKGVLIALVGFFALVVIAVAAMLGTRGGAMVGGGEIVWWGLWIEEDAMRGVLDEFEAAHPGVSVTYIKQSPQDYRERLQSSLARGEGPDIFRFHNTWVPMFERQLSALPSGVLTPAEFSQTFYPVAVDDLTVGTKILGLPLQYDGLTLFINEDIFAANGKQPPTSWVEFRQLALELTRRSGDDQITQAGTALGLTQNVDYWPEILALMMLQNGADPAVPSSVAAIDALAFFASFAGELNVWNVDLPPSTLAFANGQLAMYFAPSARVEEIKRLNPALRFKSVPLPQLPKANPQIADVAYATYWVDGVWEKSDSSAVAWELLKFVSTPESLQKINSGSFAYPRRDMGELTADSPTMAGLLGQAAAAKSWYLASRTFDGPTGINSQLANIFAQAVNETAENDGDVGNSMEKIESAVQDVLRKYGLVK